MSRVRYTAETIIAKLREAEVEQARGQTVPQVCKKIGVAEQTYYRLTCPPNIGPVLELVYSTGSAKELHYRSKSSIIVQ